MIKATFKTVGTLIAGAVLSFMLYEGYYYYELLRWVDNIRINQAIQQAAQQQQHAAAPSPPTK